MGLDMYLTGHAYPDDKKDEYDMQIDVVICTIGYWRKANAIHKWFVDNVQDKVDDCKEYRVTRDKLEQLKKICSEVIEEKDPSKLPTQSGFFFGSTSYDECYYQDLHDTIEYCDKALKRMNDDEHFRVYYRSSW